MKLKDNIKKYLDSKKYLDFFLRNIKRLFPNLEDGGERVDIGSHQNIFLLGQNEKCHLLRYEFASSLIVVDETVGDMACGTGYGSVILAKKAKKVIGIDLNDKVIDKITAKYKDIKKVEFIQSDLLKINYENVFDRIVSFETIEHFQESDIVKLLGLFNKALKKDGKIILSTPYMQEMSDRAVKMGFHKTFYINEDKILKWFTDTGFVLDFFVYQNYETCNIEKDLKKKDFIIGIAKKINQ